MSEPERDGLTGGARLVWVENRQTCAESVRADARLLRSGWPSVRVAVISEVSLSYGVGVREDAPYLLRARAAGVATVRRSSGGTGVLHRPGDLVWSVVLPRTDRRVGRDFVQGYARFGRGVVRFLARNGVTADWRPAPDLLPDYCVLSGRGHVLGTGAKILGGAAQHLTQTSLLHQGMVPLKVDGQRVKDLFGLSDRGPLQRLAGLRDLGIRATPEALARDLASSLSEDLGETVA